MTPWQDKATASIKIATDILFVKNPVGTSMGVLTGVILHGIVGMFSPFLVSLKVINPSALNIGHYIAIGVFGFNVGNFRRRHKINPEIEEALAFIKQMRKEGKISASQAKLEYLSLIKKVVENVQLDQATQNQLKAMSQAISEKTDK